MAKLPYPSPFINFHFYLREDVRKGIMIGETWEEKNANSDWVREVSF